MFKKILVAGLAAIALAAFAGASLAQPAAQPQATQLLSVDFAPRDVVKIEGGDFHFIPGQPAPLHTHLAPAIGVVTKGTILYQVEGQPLQTLRPGDAFFEPVGPKILRFDNGSATEEAVFIDTNWQQAGEPFIHFDAPPTAKIDRRTLTTAVLDGSTLVGVEVQRVNYAAGQRLTTNVRRQTTYGFVVDGALELRRAGLPVERVEAGQSFVASRGRYRISSWAADGKPATVVTFTGRETR